MNEKLKFIIRILESTQITLDEMKSLINKIEELSFLMRFLYSVESEFDCYAKIEFLFNEQQKAINNITVLTKALIEKG